MTRIEYSAGLFALAANGIAAEISQEPLAWFATVIIILALISRITKLD